MNRVRTLLLVLVLVGTAGIAAELVLLEHYGSLQQFAPLGLSGAGLAAGTAVGLRARPASVRLFQAAMVAFVCTGLIGLWLHYRGNEAFELEIQPAAEGLALLWSSLRGATPTLAPGAFVQVGLLGLIVMYDHPVLRPPQAAISTGGEKG